MTPQEFIAKWSRADLKERSAAQEHFLDLCRLLGQPTPAEADAQGAWYTFEKGADKTTGGSGFADVWMQGYFAWEYKGNHANLAKAYQQLLQYREALENPPLLVVCDLTHFEIHTNFTNTAKRIYAFSLAELDQEENLAILRALFTDPERLRPEVTREHVTEQAAARFGELALSLQSRGVEPHRAAHFLVQILFCLFAEDIGLLPNKLFSKLLGLSVRHPEAFPTQVQELFIAMRDGGYAAYEDILHFNGGLFAEIGVEPLTKSELEVLARAAELDWSSIEPAIIGTLFERSLDPARRAQLGAHYTGRADIERVVEPVVMQPLRRRWGEVRAAADQAKAEWDKVIPDIAAARDRRSRSAALRRSDQARQVFANILFGFQEELAEVRILDPACGSGNFLYVALSALKDLEKEIVAYGAENGLTVMLPRVQPTQLYGLEINDYARELTQAVIWIGYLQWMTANGYQPSRDPVLQPLETIRLQDSLLDLTDPEHPREAVWPKADFIIGNPPFLGGNKIRGELGDSYVENLFRVYDNRVPHFADLVCYFIEKARAHITAHNAQRAGLLATNSIRGGANRRVLDRIKETTQIFTAWSDEPWILEGAAVRISVIGFGQNVEAILTLNGAPVLAINADLTGEVDITIARPLPENGGISFTGIKKTGKFDIPGNLAREWLSLPVNPNGRANSDVIHPIANGIDVTRRPRDVWIIDFGVEMPEKAAALYEAPFEYVLKHVKHVRITNRVPQLAERWWIHERPRADMREALAPLDRYLATPAVAKYRIFVWLGKNVIPDHQLNVFARDDDYFFGVLHSRGHGIWSNRIGTSLEDRPRYTPTTTFETFPLPWPPGTEPVDDPRVQAIAEAAKELNERREAWLNPPDASKVELKKRTLTNLYNARPTWLAQVHVRLDRAVWDAYGWNDEDPEVVDEEVVLTRLLKLNYERAHADIATGRQPSQ